MALCGIPALLERPSTNQISGAEITFIQQSFTRLNSLPWSTGLQGGDLFPVAAAVTVAHSNLSFTLMHSLECVLVAIVTTCAGTSVLDAPHEH